VLTIHELIGSLSGALGVAPPRGNMPFGLAMALGAVVEMGWRVLRRPGPPPLSPFIVAMLHRNSGFSIEKARRELGYVPLRQWEESLAEMLAWCQEVA
jgi:2-alkyl-3-oxoalkanoate reductase